MDIEPDWVHGKAKALGTLEAVQMICCMDKEYMNGFRGVDYKRTKSVAEGDDCCDYRSYAYANMHEDFMKGKITLIGCPKLDDVDYTEKLTEIIAGNDIKSVTVVRMEVP